eukprot:3628927-Rhodomonas_salina.4
MDKAAGTVLNRFPQPLPTSDTLPHPTPSSSLDVIYAVSHCTLSGPGLLPAAAPCPVLISHALGP